MSVNIKQAYEECKQENEQLLKRTFEYYNWLKSLDKNNIVNIVQYTIEYDKYFELLEYIKKAVKISRKDYMFYSLVIKQLINEINKQNIDVVIEIAEKTKTISVDNKTSMITYKHYIIDKQLIEDNEFDQFKQIINSDSVEKFNEYRKKYIPRFLVSVNLNKDRLYITNIVDYCAYFGYYNIFYYMITNYREYRQFVTVNTLMLSALSKTDKSFDIMKIIKASFIIPFADFNRKLLHYAIETKNDKLISLYFAHTSIKNECYYIAARQMNLSIDFTTIESKPLLDVIAHTRICDKDLYKYKIRYEALKIFEEIMNNDEQTLSTFKTKNDFDAFLKSEEEHAMNNTLIVFISKARDFNEHDLIYQKVIIHCIEQLKEKSFQWFFDMEDKMHLLSSQILSTLKSCGFKFFTGVDCL